MPSRLSLFGIALALIATSAHACTTITATTITSNTTWGPSGSPPDTCYVISPSSGTTLTIQNGATLTIQANTVIKFVPGKSLVVGGASTSGSLIATGTASDAVVFTSNSGLQGDWGGLDFADNSDLGGASSNLSNCIIRRGGTGGFQVRITNSDGVTLNTCVIAEHANRGLVVANSHPSVTSCQFRDFGLYPVSGPLDGIASLFANNAFVPRGDGKYGAIEVRSTTVAASITLSKSAPNFCYFSGEGIDVRGVGFPVLTIADGTLFKLFGGFIRTGYNGGLAGGLKAKGVVFTSARDDTLGDTDGTNIPPAPGDWDALAFDPSTLDGQTVIDSCIVRYGGGYFNGGLYVNDSDPTITRCVVQQNLTNGLRVEQATYVQGLGIHDNLFRGNTTYQIAAPPWTLVNLTPSNQVVQPSSTYKAFQVRGGTVLSSMTLPKPPTGFCYILLDEGINVQGPGNPVLTIADGTLLKLSGGAFIQTGYSGQAGGLKAKGVVFTSARDDTLGDTDGTANPPAPGDWQALAFYPATLDKETAIDSCIVRYGGSYFNGGLYVNDSDPTITRCVVRQNLANGLHVEAAGYVQGLGIHDNLFRDNTTYQISAPPWTLVNLMPSNQVVQPSSTYKAVQVRGGTVLSSMTLPKPPAGFCYFLNEGIEVRGPGNPVLTIADGTLFKLSGGAFIRTGYAAQAGGLKAKGVVFTSARDDTLGDTDGTSIPPAPGDWDALAFDPTTLDGQTVIDSCIVRYGGGYFSGGLYVNDSDPTITRSVARLNLTNGLRVEQATYVQGLGIHDNLFRDNTTYQIAAPPWTLVNLMPSNQVVQASSTYKAYQVRGGTVLNGMTLPKPPAGFCYILVSEGIDVRGPGNPVLTLADGTLFKLSGGAFIRTGYAGQAGGLKARGVVFTSARDDTLGDTDGTANPPAPGDWDALVFDPTTLDEHTAIDSCIVRYGGSYFDGGLYVNDSDPTITRCVAQQNFANGLRVEAAGYVQGLGIHDNLFRDNTTFEISAPPWTLASLIPNNRVELSLDGKYDGYQVWGGTVTASMTLPQLRAPFCYFVSGSITVASGVTLTIPKGTVLKMGSGLSLVVQGTLLTDGKITAPPYTPTVFTSYREDSWYGDTNGNGADVPAAGDWGRVELQGAGSSTIRGTVFEYGGAGSAGQLYLNGTGPTVRVRECHFRVGLADGGVHLINSTTPIDSCSFNGPTSLKGIVNVTSTNFVDARNNWWGDPTGPYDPSVVDVCTNPSGLGVGVSDNVRYCPWLASKAPIVDVPEPSRRIDETRFVSASPVPSSGSVSFTLELAPGRPAALEVFDSSGRRVWHSALEPGLAGSAVSATWNGRLGDGSRGAPGVYFARLTQGGTRTTKRIIMLR